MSQELDFQKNYNRDRFEVLEKQISRVYLYGLLAIGFLLLVNFILFFITLQPKTKSDSKEASPRTNINNPNASSPHLIKTNEGSDSFH